MITTIFLHKKGGEKIMDCFDLVWFLAKNVLDRKGLSKKQGRGRPPADPRTIVRGIMFVLSEGIPWRKLPTRFGAFQTVNRYFLEWSIAGVFEELYFEVLRILDYGYVKF
jgi:hypothetical protein